MTSFELVSVLFGPHVHFNIYPYDIICFLNHTKLPDNNDFLQTGIRVI